MSLSIVLILLLFAPTEADASGTVRGRVILKGDAPAPTIVKLKPDMQKVTGKKTLRIRPWLVGKDKGLANCVVTFTATEPSKRKVPKPLKEAFLEKDGGSFVPRVLVVTKGTKLTYRNKNSPCKCFNVAGRKHNANPLVPAGAKYEMQFKAGRDICSVRSNLRP